MRYTSVDLLRSSKLIKGSEVGESLGQAHVNAHVHHWAWWVAHLKIVGLSNLAMASSKQDKQIVDSFTQFYK